MKQLFICILLFASRSFAQTTNIGGFINDWTDVNNINFCSNTLTVSESVSFKAGDTVVVFQMKGAEHIGTNTNNYGDITAYNSAGSYEFNYVLQKTGNDIILRNSLTQQYNHTNGAVQLIRVPYYTNARISTVLNCIAWDGTSGGVVIVNVADTLEFAADIDVSEKGFKGGAIGTGYTCGSNNWANGIEGGFKGESIAEYTPNQDKGGAHLTNGGGGSFAANCGAGGGGNYGEGGIGGKEYVNCSAQRQSIGGSALDYTSTGKIFFGGGGGGGEQDNGFTVYPGGRGGGIVLIKANVIKGNNYKILSNGQSVLGITRDEGGSGGGAGGSIALFSNTITGNIIVEAKGGEGSSNNDITYATQCRGPGGGGGGGVLALSNSSIPISISFTANGGLPGKVLNPASSCYNTSFGAASGADGGIIINQVLQTATAPFRKNIDSVRIKDSLIACKSYDFRGLSFTNTFAITNWAWEFGDGFGSNLQNAQHTYTSNGTYTVKLFVTDANNCKDTSIKQITVADISVSAGADTAVCKNSFYTLNGNGNGTYSWSPGNVLNDSTLKNPVALMNATTNFRFTITNGLGCSGTDSVTIAVRPAPVFNVVQNVSGCINTPTQLSASGGDVYLWSPASLVSNAGIRNPTTTLVNNQLFTVKINETTCNDSAIINTLVTIHPNPVLSITKSNDITCTVGYASLFATGASQYSWSPQNTLNNSTGPATVASPLSSTTYFVSGTDGNGCIGKDSINVLVNFTGKANYFMPNSFTPNGDGKNDCYGIKYFGLVQELKLYIFNRMGERVFATTNPNACWDGNYKGQPAEPGNYVYYLKAKTACGPVEKRDNLILLR